MAPSAVLDDVRRCPVCLLWVQVKPTDDADTRLECPRCRHTFKLSDALRAAADEDPETSESFRPAQAQRVRSTGWLWLVGSSLLITLIISAITWNLGWSMKGKTFLGCYIGFVALVTVGQWLVRTFWEDRWLVSNMALILVETVGAARCSAGDRSA